MSVPTDYIPPETILGTTTSWLPVTTAYPSVSGCASAFFWFPGQPGPAAWDPGYGYFAGGTLRCLPPAATSWHEQDHQAPDGYTSLSIRPIVCPAAFTTAATEIRSSSSTLVMCCPSGYDLAGGQPGRAVGQCRSSVSSGQIVSYTASTSSWFSSSLAFTTATYISAVDIKGWNVASSTSSPTRSASASSSSQTQTANASPGLSTGAKAGIGVGIAVGVIGVCCLVFALLLLRRRRAPASTEPMVYAEKVAPGPTQELQGGPEPLGQAGKGAQGPVHELRTKENPQELE